MQKTNPRGHWEDCARARARHRPEVDFFLGYPNFRDTLWLEFKIYRATVFCNQ